MRYVFTISVTCVAIVGIFYIADYGVSTRAIPSLDEFIASSTQELATNEPVDGQTSLLGVGNATSSVGMSSTSTAHAIFRAPKADFRVIVAKTPETRELGLSGRASLAPDEGMLFIFPKPGRYGFWMKDMNFPVDIVWIDKDREVVAVSESVQPETYPESFNPPREIQFVLEVNAGAAKGSGLEAGNTVIF